MSILTFRSKYYERNRSNGNKKVRVDPSIRSPACMSILTSKSKILWQEPLEQQQKGASESFHQKSRLHVNFDIQE